MHRNSKRFILKTIACIFGITVLFFIAITYRNNRIKEEKEPYLTGKEIYPVAEAFYELQGKKIEGTLLQEKLAEDYVTVKEIKEFLLFFPLVKADFLQEYKKDSWYIGREDWNQILVELVSLYGKEEIVLRNLAVIGDETIVQDEAGQPLEKGTVLTDQGVFRGVYWNMTSYLYSSVQAVCREKDILSIIDYSDTQTKRNVYLAGISEKEVHFFTQGHHIRYPMEEDRNPLVINGMEAGTMASGIYDLSFDRGRVTVLADQMEYLNGKLIQITENEFEIEGYGIYQTQEDMAVYRIYGELSSKEKKDLRIGYDFTDFVLRDGKITACLMVKDEDMEYIRVLLKNSDYVGRYHENFTAQCDRDYEVIYYEEGKEIKRETQNAGDIFSISKEQIKDWKGRIKLVPKALSALTRIDSIGRSQGAPFYRGSIEITSEKEGFLIVNEVLLEDYLRNVVPSEMPSSYPKEALMAQAVCARTYAYGKMINAGLASLGAHLDDSAGFQVYNNIKEQDRTTEAVRATHDMIVVYQGQPIGTYYYSTSCGVGTDASVWHGSAMPDYLTAQIIAPDSFRQEGKTASELVEEEKFRKWIENTDASSYEAQEGWYRWKYAVETLDVSHMEEVLQIRYENNPGKVLVQNEQGEFESRDIPDLEKITDIRITKRLPGGVADEMIITTSKAVIKVMTELNIRYVLADGKTKVLRQSGDYVTADSALPSAFLILELDKDEENVIGYTAIGGGFGHGVGMSQNGAKNMAESGMTYEEILKYFYPGVEIKELQFGE